MHLAVGRISLCAWWANRCPRDSVSLLSSRIGREPLAISPRKQSYAPADGYTLLGTDAAAAINAALFDNLNFNFIRDMALVGMSRGPLVVAVHPSLPVKTIPEFITYAKANPGKIALGSSGTGGINHMAGELFRTMTGINMTHVPYRGAAPAMTDCLADRYR